MANEGVKLCRKVQLGKETTAGVAVAATTIWRGSGVLEDKREVVFIEEDVGYLSRTDRTNTPKLLGAISIEGDATFEQLIHVFNAGIKAVVTPSNDGTGSGKIYEFPLPTTTPNTITTYTIEGGDNAGAEEMQYSVAEQINLDGAAGEALQVSADFFGREVTPTEFSTAGVTLPSVESINFGKGRLYIDAITGTHGTTQIANSFLSFKLELKTGWKPIFTGDGEKYFTFCKNIGPELTCEFTLEHAAPAISLLSAYRSEVAKLVRIKFVGSALGTAGTVYTHKALIIDMAGKFESVEAIDDEDGDDVRTFKFRAGYDSTAAKFATFTIVNEVNALP